MTALSLSRISKTYDDGTVALSDINLNVSKGEFFGLLGPNGAGKSTLIGIVSSLVRKSTGQVRVFGHDLDRDPWGAKCNLGLVPQEFNFNNFETVEQILLNQAGYYGVPRRQARGRAEKYLKALGLWDKRNTVSRNLSGGMKRRLMIARALVHEPGLLILDEPTAGVDIELRRSMWDFLRYINDEGVTIILTTHYLEEAESLCRNLAIIDGGRIIENTDVRTLLRSLSTHTFILDLVAPPDHLPEVSGGYRLKTLDDHTLEVEVDRHNNLTELFAQLDEAGIRVASMKNKANRLEETFVRLVQKEEHQGA
ncbi:ABC-2 type transport system ATP-binding protein [Alkalispirillum mobile]|uniref:ABC-2 type transport system ATP-binding protein n=2 Tax=Alkalispirillum mobile TaxID=85925 RepID=A0A498C5C7_9GAMM|nr:ABC-2 type transport system ATP-binding protein [Alkalispirillum mobile]